VGPWEGREIFIISFYVQEIRSIVVTLKRNRIIYPEVAVNGQIFAWKIEIFFKLPGKFEIFCENA